MVRVWQGALVALVLEVVCTGGRTGGLLLMPDAPITPMAVRFCSVDSPCPRLVCCAFFFPFTRRVGVAV